MYPKLEYLLRSVMLVPLLLIFLFLTGCSTIHSKIAVESQQGHPYSGITMDALAIKCLWELPSVAKKEDGSSYFVSVPVSVLGTAYFLVDMPFSLVGDTLWLPGDFAMEPTHERWSVSQPCRKSGPPEKK
jgi:uncharacterized protein YceK